MLHSGWLHHNISGGGGRGRDRDRMGIGRHLVHNHRTHLAVLDQPPVQNKHTLLARGAQKKKRLSRFLLPHPAGQTASIHVRAYPFSSSDSRERERDTLSLSRQTSHRLLFASRPKQSLPVPSTTQHVMNNLASITAVCICSPR
ncbi:unnamed protein product, partial [Ectocarpus sp. 8 AP-2014]